MGGLKTAQQFIERVQDLFREPFTDLVLELPAILK